MLIFLFYSFWPIFVFNIYRYIVCSTIENKFCRSLSITHRHLLNSLFSFAGPASYHVCQGDISQKIDVKTENCRRHMVFKRPFDSSSERAIHYWDFGEGWVDSRAGPKCRLRAIKTHLSQHSNNAFPCFGQRCRI